MKILKIRSMMSIRNLKTTVTQQVWILLTIQISCLNRGKLHLNRKGTAALAKNFCRFVRSLPVD